MSKHTKKQRPANPLPIDKLERNTLTLSLVIILISLFCLPYIEKGGDTWYVLMLVFIINAALLLWIFLRIIHRMRRDREE